MNLLRLLLLGLAVWIIIILVRNARSRNNLSSTRPDTQVENMVACAQCGLHLPETEAIREGGHYFCSGAHKAKHREG